MTSDARPASHIPTSPARFLLIRDWDYSGVSGIGCIAEGVQFSDGTAALRWRSAFPATTMWASLSDLLTVHGHHGTTRVCWLDTPSDRADEART